MKKLKFLANLILVVSFLINCSDLQAEDSIPKRPKRYFNIHTSTRLMVPTKLSNTGLSLLSNPFTPTMGGGFGYSRHFNRHWGFDFNYNFVLLRSKVNTLLVSDEDFVENYTPLVIRELPNKGIQNSVQFSIFKDFFVKPDVFIRISGGASLDFNKVNDLYSLSYGSFLGTGFDPSFALESRSFRPDGRSRTLSYFGKIGVGKMFKRSYFSANLFAQHNPYFLTYGRYEFSRLKDSSSGFTKWNASNLGLEFNYSIGLGK